MYDIVIILMTDTLDEIRERMKKMSHEEKMELARLASEAFARRRMQKGT